MGGAEGRGVTIRGSLERWIQDTSQSDHTFCPPNPKPQIPNPKPDGARTQELTTTSRGRRAARGRDRNRVGRVPRARRLRTARRCPAPLPKRVCRLHRDAPAPQRRRAATHSQDIPTDTPVLTPASLPPDQQRAASGHATRLQHVRRRFACGVWGVGCGVWGVGCGVRVVGFGVEERTTWRPSSEVALAASSASVMAALPMSAAAYSAVSLLQSSSTP